MITYRSCEAINQSFIVTEEGEIACPRVEKIITNSLQRAYIFLNLFFYDVTQQEVAKLAKRINTKCDALAESSGVPRDAVEQLFPGLSAQFKIDVGDNSLDPLIKVELSKVKKHLSLQLSKAESKLLDQMYVAIFTGEVAKFKKAVIFTQDNGGKPYQINFSQKYLDGLTPRAKMILKPTIKMLAYLDGRQFATFEATADWSTVTYTWSDEHPTFDEEKLKAEIKSVIASQPEPVV